MKTACFVVILLFAALMSKATDTLVTRLINSIYLEEVDSSARFYYLVDSASNPKFNIADLEDQRIDKELINEVPFNEFLFNIQHDTAKINWIDFNLVKAKCTGYHHLPLYGQTRVFKYMPHSTKDSILKKMEAENILPVLVKPRMTKSELKKAEERATKKYEDRPKEEKIWYIFSKPVFSNNKHYVLISLDSSENGCVYIFKLVNGSWLRVLRTKCRTT